MKRMFGYLFVPVYYLAKAVSLFCLRMRLKIMKRRVNVAKRSQQYGENDAK
jgi:hypothetical protein